MRFLANMKSPGALQGAGAVGSSLTPSVWTLVGRLKRDAVVGGDFVDRPRRTARLESNNASRRVLMR